MIPYFSHSFDIAGNDLTNKISKTLGVDYKTAEDLKQREGLLRGEEGLGRVLKPLLEIIANEIRKTAQIFYDKEGRPIESFILAGSSGFLPGLKDYFSETLGTRVKIAFPFANMLYPSVLEEELRRIGPGFSIATGLALRGLE